MARKSRYHIDELPDGEYAPRHLTKQQFGRRVYQEMLRNGWNQSELARQAGLPRDSISTYVRGQVLPSPISLQKLADALGVKPADLLPNAVEHAIDEDEPYMEMKVSTSAPSMAWLRVNRLVSVSPAAQIINLLAGSNHEAADAGRGGRAAAEVDECGQANEDAG